MATRENKTRAQDKALNAAQVLFTADPRFLAPQAKHILQMQERFFDEAEKFASTWFQRRQEATQAMIDAGRRLASEGKSDPGSALKEIVEWQTRSMERLAVDVKDYTEMLGRCTGTLVNTEADAQQDTPKSVTQSVTSSKSDPI